MAFDGSGTFDRLYNWATRLAAGSPDHFIDVTTMDAEMDGFADGLSACLTRAGEAGMTGTLPLDGQRIDFDTDSDTSLRAANDDVITGEFGGSDGVWMGHGTGNTGAFVHLNPGAKTLTANTSFGILRIGNDNALTVPAGTTAIGAALYAEVPNWTATGTLTDTATVYVEGAPTEGGTGNYALWVDDGITRLDGQVLMGHTTSITSASIAGQLQIAGASVNAASMSLGQWAAAASSSRLVFTKSRNASVGSFTIVQDNDPLGAIIFAGDDGTDVVSQGASIIASVDGTPGANDMPGRLSFLTTPDGGTTPVERVRINAAGLIGIDPEGQGLDPKNELHVFGAAAGGWVSGVLQFTSQNSAQTAAGHGARLGSGVVSGGAGFNIANAGQGIGLYPNDTLSFQAASNGDIILGTTSAILTTATGGFLIIPTMAGDASGVPTNAAAGAVMAYDTTNDEFKVYTGGAWRTVATVAQ